MTTTTTCPAGCGRPSDGEMCARCWRRLRDDLGSVAELAEELTTATARQVRFGPAGIGVAVRSAEQPLPVNLHAGQVARELRQLLGSWVRDLHESHAVRWQQCGACSARWYSGEPAHTVEGCSGRWSAMLDRLTVLDTLPELAGWLLRHPSWITGHVAAPELYEELTRSIDAAWLTVDRPADRAYLGVCSAPVDGDAGECPQDLYARPDRDRVTCRRCGAEHSLTGRREILLSAVADQLLTATEISRALPELLGRAVTAAQVRGLAHRGRLLVHPPHPLDPRQAPRYRIGDVRDAIVTLSVDTPAAAACA